MELPTWSNELFNRDDTYKAERFRKVFGPLKIIKGIRLAENLHDARLFRKTLADSATYLSEPNTRTNFFDVDADSAVPLADRPKSADPGVRTLERGRLRLDAASMRLERREWRSWRLDPQDPVLGIHIQSDASPVTGCEIQGMLYDVAFNSGTVLRRYLPPMSMHYGYCGCLDKAVALLWSAWLLALPCA